MFTAPSRSLASRPFPGAAWSLVPSGTSRSMRRSETLTTARALFSCSVTQAVLPSPDTAMYSGSTSLLSVAPLPKTRSPCARSCSVCASKARKSRVLTRGAGGVCSSRSVVPQAVSRASVRLAQSMERRMHHRKSKGSSDCQQAGHAEQRAPGFSSHFKLPGRVVATCVDVFLLARATFTSAAVKAFCPVGSLLPHEVLTWFNTAASCASLSCAKPGMAPL